MRPIWSPRSSNPVDLFLARHEWAIHALQVMVEIARDTGHDLPENKRRAGGDARALRGIPVTGVPGGLGGTMAQTQPEREVVRRLTPRGE